MKISEKKWVWVVATLLLSALGAALWENILKPGFSLSATFFLRIFTLGIKSLQDQIYVEISKGLHEAVSIEIFGLIAIFVIVFYGTILQKRRKKRWQRNEP